MHYVARPMPMLLHRLAGLALRLLLPAALAIGAASAPAQSDPGFARRILWGTLFDRSSVEEVKAKYPSFQWSEADLPAAAASSPGGFVLKPADQDVRQGLARFQVGDGSILSIPTFQFRRHAGRQPSLIRVDLTVFSTKKPMTELRDSVRDDLGKTFGAARATKSGELKDYGLMQYLFFEEAKTGRVVCLTLPQDEKLPLSITYSFPAGGQEKWAPDQRC